MKELSLFTKYFNKNAGVKKAFCCIEKVFIF